MPRHTRPHDKDRHTRPPGNQTGPVTVRLITLSLRQILRLLLLTCRSSRSKDLELLVLRQELAVLRRQVPHPKTKREERLVLTVLQRLRPVHERLSSLFTPDTLRHWHRELAPQEVGPPAPDQQEKDDLPSDPARRLADVAGEPVKGATSHAAA